MSPRSVSPLPHAAVALPEPAAARRNFAAAAATFDSASAAHDRAREILLGRLQWFALQPALCVDAACGTGAGAVALAQRFPEACVLALDSSAAMLQAAAARQSHSALCCADAQALPLPDRSVDLLLANLALPWCDPQALLSECARVLAPDGLLLLSTTGPATLQELRRAWRQADDADEAVHVHAGIDLQTLGELFVRAGLREPVLDIDRFTLRYSTPATLYRELRAAGAVNCARGRRATLTGARRFRRYEAALAREAGTAEGIEVTVEFVFGQAWGAGAADVDAPSQFRGIPVRAQ